MFGPDAGQQEFYRATAAPMVRGLMDSGLSSVMMAYGVSGAGKTYTMEVRRPPAALCRVGGSARMCHSYQFPSSPGWICISCWSVGSESN